MLVFGDLVFIPFTFTIQVYFIPTNVEYLTFEKKKNTLGRLSYPNIDLISAFPNCQICGMLDHCFSYTKTVGWELN